MSKFCQSVLIAVFIVAAGIYPNFVLGHDSSLDEYSQFRSNPPFIISDSEITKQEGGVIEGKYNLVNEFPRFFADVEIVYALEKYASETKKYGTEESGATVEVTTDVKSQTIVSQSEPPVFIAPKETINKSFQLKYPIDIELLGAYRLKISFNILSDNFLPVRQYQFPITFLGDSKFNQIQPDCYLLDRDNDKRYSVNSDSPTFYFFQPLAKISVQCLFSNLRDPAPVFIPKIEIKNRNFPAETNVISGKETILAPDGFLIDLPSFSKTGSYEGKVSFFAKETNLMIISPVNFYFQMAIDPEKIADAKITLLEPDKDYYKKGETAKIHIGYNIWENGDAPPPEVKLALKIENNKGKLCGESQKDAAPRLIKEGGEEYYVYPTEEIDLAIDRKCVNPKLIASVFDKDNNELTALISQIKTQEKTNSAPYLTVSLIGLAVVLLTYYFAKRKKAASLLFIISAIGFGFFFFGINPASADHHCSKFQSFSVGLPTVTVDAANNITQVSANFTYTYTSGGQGHAPNCGGSTQTEYLNPFIKRMDNPNSAVYFPFFSINRNGIGMGGAVAWNTVTFNLKFNPGNLSINGGGDHGVYVNPRWLYSGEPDDGGANSHGGFATTCAGYSCGDPHHDWQDPRYVDTTLSFSAYWLDVNVNKVGTGNGAITGPNINCLGDCNQLFGKNTLVTIYANVTSGVFGGWSGDAAGCGMNTTCTITMNAYKNVTATFNPSQPSLIPFDLYVWSQNNGSGTVSVSSTGGPSFTCGPPSSSTNPCGGHYYNNNSTITLTANPSGSTFSWVDPPCAGGGATCSFTITGYKTMGINFIGQNITGSISASPNPCVILAGQTTCSTAINWNTTGGLTGTEVTVTNTGIGGPEQLFSQSDAGGSSAAGWIAGTPNSFLFKLYGTAPIARTFLAQVTVTGVNTPPACASGQTQTQGCTVAGCSGTQTRTCNASGNWGGWSACVDTPGDNCPAVGCANGATQACTAGGCPGAQTCSNDSWGACVDTPGDGCPAGSPDLFISSRNYSPPSPSVGSVMSFTGAVGNIGAGPAGASQTKLSIDINNDGSYDVNPPNQSTGSLSVNATEAETWPNAWTATAGTHKHRFCADATGIIMESDESNNCVSAVFTVVGNQPPIVSISCSPLTCRGYKGAGAGDPGTLKLGYSALDPDNNLSSCQFSIDGVLRSSNCSGIIYPTLTEPLGNHTASLRATDSLGLQTTTAKPFTILRDIQADFDCSLDVAGPFINNCSSLDPALNTSVYFKDKSIPSQSASLSSWSWTFQNGTPSSSPQQNPSAQFTKEDLNSVVLRVRDSASREGLASKSINISKSPPVWKEVIPR